MLVIPLWIVEYLMFVGAAIRSSSAQLVAQSLLPLIPAFLALQLQLLIFPSDPLVGDPLGAHQHRTPTVNSLDVQPAVGEKVPPEYNAALLSLHVNPRVREGRTAPQADVSEVAHHCGQPVTVHRGLGPAQLVSVLVVVVMIEVRVCSKLSCIIHINLNQTSQLNG